MCATGVNESFTAAKTAAATDQARSGQGWNRFTSGGSETIRIAAVAGKMDQCCSGLLESVEYALPDFACFLIGDQTLVTQLLDAPQAGFD